MKLIRRISIAVRERRRRRAEAAVAGTVGGGGFYVQGIAAHFHAPGLTLMSFALLALALGVGAVGMEILARLVPRWRSALRTRRLERNRRLAAADAERRARALMSELCPHGWRAQITLFSPSDPLLLEAGSGGSARVALDWAELEDETGRPVVIRRVWAPTIADALEAMVADRRTDETLEQIEHGATADGAPWPDLYL